MDANKLTERDRRLLRRLVSEPADARALAAATGFDDETVEERLAVMAGNGLVLESAGGDGYELADSGRRLLDAPGDGSADDRVDVPPEAEDALAALELPADRSEAVRAAFAFLRYWGDATPSEIRDAVFTERHAGYDSRRTWWDDFVADALAALPDVESADVAGDSDVAGDADDTGVDVRWRYVGRPGTRDDADGRDVLDGAKSGARASERTFGSARHALESADLTDDERAAARSAFALLEREEDVSEGELSAVRALSKAALDALESAPGVEREGGSWRYDVADV